MVAKTKWVVDPSKSEINFEIEHFILPNILGKFKTFNAGAYSIANDFTVDEINLTISSRSVSTGDSYCDQHFKNIFNAEDHKQILFRGRIFEKSKTKRTYKLLGDLTIKGITQRIELEVQFKGINKNFFGKERANFLISGIINRNDWALNFNPESEAWKFLLNDKVKINCNLQLKRSTIQEVEMPIERILEQNAKVNYANM